MKKFLIIISSLSIGVLFGIFFASNHYKSVVAEVETNAYSQAWAVAQERLSARGLNNIYALNNAGNNKVSGTVTAVNNDYIQVKIVPFEILANPDLDIRELIINENTIITYIKKKLDSVYQKELVNFYADNPSAKDSPDPGDGFPSKFETVSGSISDIEPGQKISAEAEGSIIYEKSFIVKSLTITTDN